MSFWNKQPVVTKQTNKKGIIEEEIEMQVLTGKKIEKMKKTQLDDLYTFLKQNYVSSENCRLVYPRDLLEKLLYTPTTDEDLLLIINRGKEITGFISGIPITLNGLNEKVIFVNFLCVDKKLRNKKITPILINELITRSYRKGYRIAFYTSGSEPHLPVMKKIYFHRPLNVEKLIKLKFLPYNFYDSPVLPLHFKWDRLTKENINLVNTSINTKIYQVFSKEEAEHYFLNCTETYVSKKGLVSISCVDLQLNGGNIKQGSIYMLIGEEKIKILSDAIYLAKSLKYDVLNFLGNDEDYLSSLYFIKGTGVLNYYFFNYNPGNLLPDDIDFNVV